MNKNNFSDLLAELCSLRGISGHEYPVARAIKALLCERGAKVEADRMGNVCAKINGKGQAPSIMLIAHMDEVGAIVSEISDNGLILFKTVGAIDNSTLPSTRVIIEGHPGAVSAAPAHMSAGQPPAKQYIDVGAESKVEVLSMGINIGSMVTFDTPYIRMTENRVCSHAIDDRVGCAILISLFDAIDFTPDGDIYLGFSIREETVMSGAAMLVEHYKPDCAIAIDTVPMRMNPSGNSLLDLGKGPVFQLAEGVMSSFTGNFAHPAMKTALINAANAEKTPYQLCAEYGDWTTDGSTISRANCGTPSAYLSIPRRCAHSASEIMDLRDPLNGISILKQFIKQSASINLELV